MYPDNPEGTHEGTHVIVGSAYMGYDTYIKKIDADVNYDDATKMLSTP